MEDKDIERSTLNGHSAGQRESPKHATVPTTLLPTVLNRLGLSEAPVAKPEWAIQSEHSSVRVAAIRNLGAYRAASSLPFLMVALHDPAWEVRAAAVFALGACGENAPVEALIEALDDEDASVRAAALRVLADVNEKIPSEALARLRRDPEWLVREAAAVTLEELEEQERLRRLSPPEVLIRNFPARARTLYGALRTEVLGERYHLLDHIGRGGMATIYRGRDMQTERVVAIKVLRDIYSTDPKFVKRFTLEAKAASALQHPNIVQVYDYGQSEGSYYIVMELVEGTDLRRYLRPRGTLEIDKAIIIAHDVALGLGAAHRRGIVHRDVKPQNILVGRGGAIKLTDFGIASVYKDINAERLTTTGMTLGTVQYYAPEQAQGEIVSPAADVYALGIVLYEMLTGHTPFDGETPVAVAMQHLQDPPVPPSQLNPSIPPALEAIILRCLEKVPEMRYRDGSQLARALEALGDAEDTETLSASSGQTLQVLPAPGSPYSSFVTSGIANEQSAASLAPQSRSSSELPYAPAAFERPSVLPEIDSLRSSAHPDVQSLERHDRRFNAKVMVPILLAAVLLLGFCLYLAIQLGILPSPFGTNSGTPSPTIIQGTVPSLIGDDYATAQSMAQQAGFTLQPSGTSTAGIVAGQNPQAGSRYSKGSAIYVMMTTKTKVPAYSQGETLEAVEQLILGAHLQYKVQADGADPALGANAVSRLDPPSGTQVDLNTVVTIYVKNLGATPGASPTPSPMSTGGPSPTPT